MAYRLAAPRAGTASVIILHGLGDSGAGWEFLAREFQQRPSLNHVNFVLPSAPARPISAAYGELIPGWFDLNGIGVSSLDQFTNDSKGIAKTLDYVKKLVNDEVQLGVSTDRILVGGFSQGGALTMALATTFNQKLAGFLSMSGFLPVPNYLESIASSVNKDTPFLLTHGTADPVVPCVAGKAGLKILRERFGLKDTTFETFDGMEHTVNMECLKTIAAFLERVLK